MTGLQLHPLVIISLSFLLGLILTLAARRMLIRKHLFDHPNERSSHSEPVPRGGGWALLIVLVPGMILAALADGSLPQHAGVIAAVIVLAIVSWFDDRKSNAGGISAIKRLSLHIFAACLGSTAFSYDDTLFAGALPFWLDRGLMIVGWAWFMNLYNFMDGIDGITCTETIALATGACLLMTATGMNDPFLHTLTLMLTGASLGFLVLNWHPAKIFLGDVGSVPLGFLTGFALLSLAVQGFLIPAFILPLYYVADSGITITKRAMRREKIWQAHRQHFYQRATLGLGRHDKVVLWIVAANIGLICAALLAVTYPLPGLGIAVAMVAILLWKMHKTSP
jgi:UDP-N-acetylmuramyl pentapeptide phosphotransferase/UDP-N-acetylglucosamine-1-phosphate transferase